MMVSSDAQIDRLAFQHAVTALAAKLVIVDGAADTRELDAFAMLFPFEGASAATQRALFTKHAQDVSSPVQFARQILGMQVHAVQREELLRRLVMLAASDGVPNAQEIEWLRGVSVALEVPMQTFRALILKELNVARSPFEVLGVSRRASEEETRARYLQQVRALHPDQYAASGASVETLALLNERLATVNRAFETVMMERGFALRGAPKTKGIKAAA